MAKSSKSRNDTAIQGTNDSSVVSKCCMMSQGYFHDNYLKYFVSNKVYRRSPLINRGYYIRAQAVNHVLQAFLSSTDQLPRQPKQIVSLGAGFDSAYFRLEAEGSLDDCTFFEVDFLDVAKRKAGIIDQQSELSDLIRNRCVNQEMLNKGVVLRSSNYQLLGVDMTKLNELSETLQLTGIDFNKPTLLLSECVMTYMPVKRSDALISWAAETFRNAMFVTYEQVSPDDAFGKVMLDHFKKLGSPLKAIQTYPTITAQKMRYLTLGWDVSIAINMNELYFNILTMEERQRIEKLEPFDEFEEWQLKCSHYVVVCSFTGNLKLLSDCVLPTMPRCSLPDREAVDKPGDHVTLSKVDVSQPIRRFGHATCLTESGEIVVIGGFGETRSTGKHERLGDIEMIHWKQKKTSLVQPKQNTVAPRMFHSVSKLSGNKILIFGGRTSPTKPLKGCEIVSFQKEDETLCYECHNFECIGNIPSPRWRHSASVVATGDTEYAVIFGGRTAEELALADCYLLNSKTWTWEEVKSSGGQPCARHSHSAAVYKNNRVVITGGLNSELKALNSMHVLHCDRTPPCWEKLNPVPEIQCRYSHTCELVGDQLLLLGGVSHSSQSQLGLAVIHLQTMVHQEYSLPGIDPEFPIMLHNHRSHLVSRTALCIVGGGGNCFSFGTHLNTTPFVFDVKDIIETRPVSD